MRGTLQRRSHTRRWGNEINTYRRERSAYDRPQIPGGSREVRARVCIEPPLSPSLLFGARAAIGVANYGHNLSEYRGSLTEAEEVTHYRWII